MAKASLDTISIRPLTLSFSDAETERAFRADHAAKSSRPLRVLFLVILGLIAIGTPFVYFDPMQSLDTWTAHLPEFWPRAGTAVLLFTGLVLAGLCLTFADRARDITQLWAAGYMVLYTPLPLYAAEVMPLDFQRHLYPLMMMHLVNIHLIVRLRFINATIVALLATATYLAWGGARLAVSGAELRQQVMNLALANAFGAFGSYQIELYTRREYLQTQLLEAERAKSDQLLLNVLPPAIAERLKAGEEPIADGIDQATILFADIVGFTELAAEHPPDRVVDMLNELFVAFDALADKHGLEKIKTIGDAYMIAGGLFDSGEAHATAAADMALDMMHFVDRMREAGNTDMHLRIGINTGPVVGGVIGLAKFSYDLWGDAVNTAARMESHGVVDAIHISAATRAHLGAAYHCEPRGPITIKGKGEMQTFLLRGRS